MYCPTCGSEERQLSQYCRACGTDLRSVRNTLERPDSVTASAISAREQISRAIADRIRETQSAGELQKVAEEVLPEIEKFLESPVERRLRRVRAGIIVAFIGLGACVGGILSSVRDEDLIVLIFPGMVALFIGLAVVINGLLFTLPKKEMPRASDDLRKALESTKDLAALDTAGLSQSRNRLGPEQQPAAVSVTEHTTKHLAEKRS